MSSPIRALLLDLDGTLVDSVPVLATAWHAFLLAHGKQGTDEEFTRYVGPPLDVMVSRIKDEFRLAEPLATLLADYQARVALAYAHDVDLACGACGVLRWAATNAWQVAVVTSAPRALAGALLGRLGVSALLVAGDDVEHGKPAPDPYLEACRRLQVCARDVVAVEDSPSGVLSAVTAGVRCIAIAQAQSAPALRECGAWLLVPSLREALGALECCAAGTSRLTRANSLQIRHLGKAKRRASLQARVDRCWEDAVRERSDIYDGGLFTISTWIECNGQIRMELLEDSYRPLLAQRGGIEMGLWAVAVMGLVVWRDHLLVGRRSSSVNQYPGTWEAVPSGGYEPAAGTDPVRQLYQELKEELGLSPSSVDAPEFLGVLEDLADRVVDIVYRLRVPDKLPQPELLLRRSTEHVELKLVRRDELASLEPRIPGLLDLANLALRPTAGRS